MTKPGWSVSVIRGQPVLVSEALPGFRCAPSGLRGRCLRSLRGFEEGRGAGAELRQQRGFLGFGRFEVTLLDVAEAADFFGDRRESDRERVVLGRELGDSSSISAS